jgi:hypothetical protein
MNLTPFSVVDPGCLSRIRIYSIPDPESRIQQKKGEKINLKFSLKQASIYFTKFKNYYIFIPKNCYFDPRNMGWTRYLGKL